MVNSAQECELHLLTNSDDDCDDVDIGVNGIEFNKIKPVLEEKFKKAVDNFEELMENYSLKCKDCEFEA